MQNNQNIAAVYILSKHQSRSIVWYVWMSLLMFFFIYEFNFDAFGLSTYLTSRRVSIFILFVMALLKGKKILPQGIARKTIKEITWLHVFLLIYSFVLIALVGRGTGSHISDSIMRLFLFGLVPIWCFYQLFDNVDEFLKVVLIATLIQAVLILASLVNPAFGEYLDTTFATEEKTEYIVTHRIGYAGGLACITAPGCLRFSMGLVAAFYYSIKNNNPITIILFAVLSVIATMVARTGFFIGLVGLIMMSIRQGANNTVKFVLSFFIATIVLAVINNMVDIRELFDFYRLYDLLYGKGAEGFVNEYFYDEDMSIPPLTFEQVFLGTGIDSGVTAAGVKVNVDGGFLRLYSAYGFVISVFFYLFMFRCFLKNASGATNKILKSTLLFFTVVILIGEFKEYTIYQQYMVCLFFSLAAISIKPQIKQ